MPKILAVIGKGSIFNERQLLSEVAEGNERSFTLLYHHYYNRLFPYFSKFTGNPLHAEEILQGTFMRVWMNRDKLSEIENFQAWVHKIATRENLSLLRREMLAARKLTQFASFRSSAPGYDRSAVIEAEELERQVREIVEQMPEQRKKIYQLSREAGYKPPEIAEILNISQSTVHNSLTTALKQIRARLSKIGYRSHLLLIILSFFSK
ncbi:MAG TPA: RNA polymerase sigma-70 factor [Puia sp.]